MIHRQMQHYSNGTQLYISITIRGAYTYTIDTAETLLNRHYETNQLILMQYRYSTIIIIEAVLFQKNLYDMDTLGPINSVLNFPGQPMH